MEWRNETCLWNEGNKKLVKKLLVIANDYFYYNHQHVKSPPEDLWKKKKLILMERSDLIQLTFKLAVYAPHENSFRKSQISLAFQDILYYYFYCLLSLHYLQCYKYFFKSINLLLFFCAIPHGSVTMSTKTMKAPHLQKQTCIIFIKLSELQFLKCWTINEIMWNHFIRHFLI